MEENETMGIHQIAEKIIIQAINKVMRKNPHMTDKGDIKIAAKTEILLPLTNANLSETIQKEIDLIMQLYDTVFDTAYERYINEKEKKGKVSNKENTTIEEKAKIFNELIAETMTKIPKEYLRDYRIEQRKQKNNEALKKLPYIPIYKGKFNEKCPKEDIGEKELGER